MHDRKVIRTNILVAREILGANEKQPCDGRGIRYYFVVILLRCGQRHKIYPRIQLGMIYDGVVIRQVDVFDAGGVL